MKESGVIWLFVPEDARRDTRNQGQCLRTGFAVPSVTITNHRHSVQVHRRSRLLLSPLLCGQWLDCGCNWRQSPSESGSSIRSSWPHDLPVPPRQKRRWASRYSVRSRQGAPVRNRSRYDETAVILGGPARLALAAQQGCPYKYRGPVRWRCCCCWHSPILLH